jgi:NitT/TauT family transport system ATP-binding protein
MNPYILQLQNITYSYHSLTGEIPALSDISFDVKQGEFLAIVGPSGCGKSTLLSIIARLLSPEGGTIVFQNPNGSLEYPKTGYMLQHDHLLEWRTIFKNVTLGLEVTHQETVENITYANKLLSDYDLYKFKDKHPGELSGGMRQRAALIRTLVLNPDILLLDEPFSALDYQTRLSVSGDIGNIIRTTGKTAILITHDLSEAISLADRVIILSARPATVKKEVSIHLTKPDDTPLAARSAPEFHHYFNLLWKELSHEKKS